MINRVDQKFASEWFYFVGFFFDHPYIQYDVLMTLFDEQNLEEKETDRATCRDGRGFSKEHIAKFNPIARKIRQSRLKSTPLKLSSAEKSDLRLLYHYFPRYFRMIEANHPPVWKMLISDMIDYSDRCRVFEEAVLVALSWRPDLRIELNELSESLCNGRALSVAEKLYEKLVGFKAIEVKEDF